jgi:PKD repeat protein
VDVTHRYNTAGEYDVRLTVTDDDGLAGTTTQTITVLAAPAQDCATNGGVVICTLDITAPSRVTLNLISRECQLNGNRISTNLPTRQTAFGNICTRPAPAEYTINDGSGTETPAVIPVGPLEVQFNQGTADPTNPVPGTPVARLEVTAPNNWRIVVDDGGDPAGQNEPDFNDVILEVHATP